MPAQLAILLCCVGVAGLFYLDRDRSVRTSRALWLPVIWIGLAGSRSVTGWFGIPLSQSANANIEGSPVDAAVFGALLCVGIFVLLSRKRKAAAFLLSIAPIIAYSVFCLISVTWSPVPVPAFKRWIKDAGDVAMVLIIATDPQPLAAMRRLYSRLGFVLFPFSVVLIRYTSMGRYWDADGNLSNTGVTDNKNMLGLIVFVLSLGALWNVRWLFVNRKEPNRNRRLAAQCIFLTFGLALLQMAHSSTSIACFLLGGGLMLAMHLRSIRLAPARLHLLCSGLVIAGVATFLLGGTGEVANALGRQSSLSGRTDIWAALIPAIVNPIIGAGFESFWNSPNVVIFQDTLRLQHWFHPERLNEAHDGYFEVFLNLGLIGVCLLVVILFSGYRSATKAFRNNREVGSLALAYIMSGVVYSITEAGFRTLSPMWIFLLLAVVSSRGLKAGLILTEPKLSTNSKSRTVSVYQETESQSVYANEAPISSPRWTELRSIATNSLKNPLNSGPRDTAFKP